MDVELKLAEINNKLCDELSMLEPFGKGNELPILLAKKLKIIDKRLLGKEDKHLKLWVSNGESGQNFEAIGFGFGDDSSDLRIGEKIDLLLIRKNIGMDRMVCN